MKELGIIDGFGVAGTFLHYGLVIAFVGSAFLLFIYLWTKGRLDMDEAPKYKMMECEQQEEEHDLGQR